MSKKEWKSLRINFSDDAEYERVKLIESYLITKGKTLSGWFNDEMERAMTVSSNTTASELALAVELVTSAELIDESISLGLKVYPKLLELIRERDFECGVDYWYAEGSERKVYRYHRERCLEKLRKRFEKKDLLAK
jgi:hypothetical protein